MKVTFRADASLEIGTGHVMRCLTLAHALQARGATCRFVTRLLPGHMADRIAADGFAVTRLPVPDGPGPDGPPTHACWAGTDWATDAGQTRDALDLSPPDWLVLDHYAFDRRWQAAARPAGTRMLVIDDLADRPHDCDVLLDQNLGRQPGDYDSLVPDRCTRLIGPRYALLRPEFAAARARALADRPGRGLRHLLVTMGGVDRADATSAVLGALREASLPEGAHITVVMGSGAPALARVRELARDMPRSTHVAVDVPDMAERMADADLAISAGGATTWERCCLGLPSIIVETADNQAEIVRAMVDAGAAHSPGALHAPGFAPTLQRLLRDLLDPERRDGMAQRAAAICDGDGAARVAMSICAAEPGFRPARRSDSRRVWEWRAAADPAARVQGGPTTFAQHDAWFCDALEDPDRLLRILTSGELPCGYLRLDRISGDCARVSVCLAPDVQGYGFGRQLLVEADRVARANGFAMLSAEVHPDNIPSRRAFEGAGYLPTETAGGYLTFHLMLEDPA